jgi:hypothetical protein
MEEKYQGIHFPDIVSVINFPSYKVKNFKIMYYKDNQLIEYYIFNQLKELIKNSVNYLDTKYALHDTHFENQNHSPESISEFFKFLTEFSMIVDPNIKYTVLYTYEYFNHDNVNEYTNKLYIENKNIITVKY